MNLLFYREKNQINVFTETKIKIYLFYRDKKYIKKKDVDQLFV